MQLYIPTVSYLVCIYTSAFIYSEKILHFFVVVLQSTRYGIKHYMTGTKIYIQSLKKFAFFSY